MSAHARTDVTPQSYARDVIVNFGAYAGNPAGYLSDGAALEEVRLGLPGREVLGFGPGWARGYEFTYFAAVVAVSLLLKVLFRIA